MCRARFFVVLALASVSSPQIVSPDGIEISDELEATLRCLVRTWIRFEWSQRCENCVVPTEDQLTEEQRLPECTPEALESAGIKVTQILAGGNRVWNAVSGWIQKSVTALPRRNTSFLDNARAISLWNFVEAAARCKSVAAKISKASEGLLHRVTSSLLTFTSNMLDHDKIEQKKEIRKAENRITLGTRRVNFLCQPRFSV